MWSQRRLLYKIIAVIVIALGATLTASSESDKVRVAGMYVSIIGGYIIGKWEE